MSNLASPSIPARGHGAAWPIHEYDLWHMTEFQLDYRHIRQYRRNFDLGAAFPHGTRVAATMIKSRRQLVAGALYILCHGPIQLFEVEYAGYLPTLTPHSRYLHLTDVSGVGWTFDMSEWDHPTLHLFRVDYYLSLPSFPSPNSHESTFSKSLQRVV